MTPALARVLLVGYGSGGSLFHAPFIDAEPRLELTTVVTADPQRRSKLAARHPGTQVAPTVHEALASGTDYALVVVTTPNATHVPVAELALARGLPVVVDKPVAPSAGAARRLGEVAARHGATVIPFQNRRYDADFATVRRLLEAGTLGTLARFESRYERWRPEVATAGRRSWKEDPDPASANGILFDLGTHLVDQAVALFGRPGHVYAELATRRAGAEVDDDAFVALQYPAGPEVHLWMSAVAARLGPRFRLLGSAAGFEKYGMDPQEEALVAGLAPTSPGFGEEPAASWGVLGTPEAAVPVPGVAGDYGRFYAGVARHLLDGGAPPVPLADAVSGLEIIEAARRSASAHQVVALAPPGR